MGRKLFVGNLPYSVDSAQLGQAFAAHGELLSANVVLDRETQRSRGFGFVEYATEDAARVALQALDGSPLNGRNITVREAEERRRPPMGEARSRPMEMRAPRRPGYEGGGGGEVGHGGPGYGTGGAGGGMPGGGAHDGGGSSGVAPNPSPAPIEGGEAGRGGGRGTKRGDDNRRRRHDDWDDE